MKWMFTDSLKCSGLFLFLLTRKINSVVRIPLFEIHKCLQIFWDAYFIFILQLYALVYVGGLKVQSILYFGGVET